MAAKPWSAALRDPSAYGDDHEFAREPQGALALGAGAFVAAAGGLPAAALAGQAIRTVGARRPGMRTAGREAAVALVSVAPALLALRSGDLAAYHGVEHKSIAGYEEGSDAAEADK